MIPDNHLTSPHSPEWQARLALTSSGMANWAGTGPANTSCRQCMFWAAKPGYVLTTVKRFLRLSDGALSPRRCQKYTSMMQGVRGDCVPSDTPACNRFAINRDAPPVKLPPKPVKVKAPKSARRSR